MQSFPPLYDAEPEYATKKCQKKYSNGAFRATVTVMNLAEAVIQLALYSAFAVPASIVDLRTRRLPDILTLPGALALLASEAFLASDTPFGPTVLPALAAAALCSALFLALRLFTNGFGLGDVKFVASTGLLCGPAGGVLALLIASASALASWAVLAALGKADRSTRVPFGPFIALGTIAAAVAKIC